MRRASWVLTALLAHCAAFPVVAGSSYSTCVQSADPADCIARRAVNSFQLTPEDTVEAVLRHGLVDLLPRNSAKLLRGLYVSIGGREASMAPSTTQVDNETMAALRLTPPKTLHACMALVAAARREANPFGNPVYLKLARLAKDDPRIPVMALGMWTEVVGMSGSQADRGVSPAGLAAIWNRALENKERDAVVLEDIAGTLAYLDELKPQARDFFIWYSQRPGLAEGDRAYLARLFAETFDLPEKAAALIEGVDENVEEYDIPRVRWSIAVARLARGYDAASAKLALTLALQTPDDKIRYRAHGSAEIVALERAGAREELRQLGAAFLARAESLRRTEEFFHRTQAADFMAAASDAYLRAGDLERARDIARRGLPLAREVVNLEAARGEGTSPVVALYITGAIDEAMQTGYLLPSARYLDAERAGEHKNPLWVLQDEAWPAKFEFATGEALRSPDPAFKRTVYDALVGSCGKSGLVNCNDETLGRIAMLAANMGDESRMKEALAASARHLDTGQFEQDQSKAFAALQVAGSWAHDEELLRAAITSP